jgi:hypothetical protein
MDKLDELHRIGNMARTWHYGNTLPWSDNGSRVLPMANFFKYKQRLNELEALFEAAAEAFYVEYPSLIGAAALKLGDLFDREDYPDVQVIRRRNKFQYAFMPIPASGDFRVDAPKEVMAELEQQYEQDYNRKIQTATNDLWERLHTCLTHMSQKLAGDDKQIFRDSLVENANELCGMLTVLNVTNDPQLERARQEVEKAIVGLTAKDLRKDNALRLDTKKRVDEILSMF